jgi:hypothetical protein
VQIDGVLSAGEWKSASKVKIEVADSWSVSVFAQHDDENLYFAFSGVKQGSKRMYPEVLLDAVDRKPAGWAQVSCGFTFRTIFAKEAASTMSIHAMAVSMRAHQTWMGRE